LYAMAGGKKAKAKAAKLYTLRAKKGSLIAERDALLAAKTERDEDMIQDLQEEQRAGVWSIFRQAPQHKRKRHRRKAAEILKNPIPSLNEAMDAILAIVVLLFLTYMYDEEFYWSIIDMTIRPVKVALGYEEYSADAADGIRPDELGRPPKR